MEIKVNQNRPEEQELEGMAFRFSDIVIDDTDGLPAPEFLAKQIAAYSLPRFLIKSVKVYTEEAKYVNVGGAWKWEISGLFYGIGWDLDVVLFMRKLLGLTGLSDVGVVSHLIEDYARLTWRTGNIFSLNP